MAGSSALEYREHLDDGEALSEAQTLREFYRAIGGKGWRQQYGWGAADVDAAQVDLNEFDGVTVGLGGRVDQIKLKDNDLSAHIFQRPEFPMLVVETAMFLKLPRRKRWNSWDRLSSLRNLTVLDLSNNSLRGTQVAFYFLPRRKFFGESMPPGGKFKYPGGFAQFQMKSGGNLDGKAKI